MAEKLPRIYVSIASYRDVECQHTVKDLFDKALFPERIIVGICWQFDPDRDKDCFLVPAPRPGQVRIAPYRPEQSKGACWARVEALSMREDEEYVLMLDAHMRFVKGWDVLMIDALENCPTKKAVISTMPPNYTPPDTLFDHKKYGLPVTAVGMISHPNQPQPVHLISRTRPVEGWGMLLSAFVVGNFIFTHAATFEEVPFDPHIFFWGEEVCFSVRLWTHGYDIYQPDKPLIYHHWFAKSRNEGEKSLYKTEKTERTQLSHLRMRHLLYSEPAPEEALVEMDKYNIGTVRPRDDFWKFADLDMKERIIGERARMGQWLPYRPRQKTDLPSIFVSIASYRDPECQHTIRDLFARARHPERIFVGICWQFDRDLDRDCFAVPLPFADNIRRVHYHYTESKGGCWARAQALSLADGEDYVLQIDAHMRFVDGWDELLLNTLARCPAGKAALSGTVPNYNPPHDLEKTDGLVHGTYVGRIGYPHELQPVHLCGWIKEASRLSPGPLPTPFFVGNFFFAPMQLFRDVPFDPNIYFRGQELVYSARLFTHGWNIYHPDRAVIYHHWHAKVRNTGDAAKYKTDNADAALAKKRVLHVLGLDVTDDKKALADINRFGMGTARPLADFWAFAGIDLKKGLVEEKAAKGLWPPYEAA